MLGIGAAPGPQNLGGRTPRRQYDAHSETRLAERPGTRTAPTRTGRTLVNPQLIDEQ